MKKETGKLSSEGSKPAPKTLPERLSPPIALVGLIVTPLLALFVYYHTQQKETWEGRLNQAKEQLGIKNQELSKVKEDLKARAENESKQSLKQLEVAQAPWPAEVTIVKSQTLTVSSDLSITLTDVTFEPNPPRYKISASVSYKGEPDLEIHDAAEGYMVTYPKEHGYKITILKAESVSAKVSIAKNP
jgi:hypothetical protein